MTSESLIQRVTPCQLAVNCIRIPVFKALSLSGVTIIQPKKRPKGGQLTAQEKATNRNISSIRIRVEHAIGGVKRFRIVKDKLRTGKRDLATKSLRLVAVYTIFA